ncbi:thioredoxin [Filobacillus milosensis]|uniref:Thioredoxin n=1 Tax=Filobacillus milosensis TaxID=94137 RepID=A0A4Y8IMZ7_9BACI|nr:thioredoxin family protein [Filobacillus milosensis]TFB21735.1 thioredoxin [Filobacillus milosensis]
MKKLLIFGSVIIVLFIVTALLTNMAETQEVEDNPYGKSSLKNSTVELLDNPNYQNIITPEDLEEKLQSEESVTVYFFSPECHYCIETTPRLMPLAEELSVDIQQYNLLEFQQGWNEYNIQATPTLVHYENGEEVARIKGAAPNEQFQAFFEEHVINN